MYADSRRPGRDFSTLEDATWAPTLAQIQGFSFGDLKLHVYSEGADRFEAQIYTSHTAGYTLDRSQPGIPVAWQNEDVPLVQVGQLSGVLTPHATPLYIEEPAKHFTQPWVGMSAEDAQKLVEPAKADEQ